MLKIGHPGLSNYISSVCSKEAGNHQKVKLKDIFSPQSSQTKATQKSQTLIQQELLLFQLCNETNIGIQPGLPFQAFPSSKKEIWISKHY